jgi:hypothetical protein
MLMANQLADRLDALATRVNNNGVRRIDPERFHAEKSDIGRELRLLARSVRGDRPKEKTTVWHAGGQARAGR